MISLRIRNTHRTCLKQLVLAVFGMLTTSACATSRIGEAEVRQIDGVPCFTIPIKEEQRAGGAPRLSALSVYDASTAPTTEIWSFASPFAKMPTLSSDVCIPYGRAPTGSETTKSIPLQVGKKYGVILNTVRVDPSDPTFAYDARFCLVANPNGGVRVQQVIYSNGWRYEACEAQKSGALTE